MDIEYAANNRVSRARDSAAGNIWKTYGHDARGNVTSNADLSFVYDLSNQPVSMSGDDTGSYVYDGNYKRVKQTINGETIYTMYNLAGEVAYRDNITTGEVTSYIIVALAPLKTSLSAVFASPAKDTPEILRKRSK